MKHFLLAFALLVITSFGQAHSQVGPTEVYLSNPPIQAVENSTVTFNIGYNYTPGDGSAIIGMRIGWAIYTTNNGYTNNFTITNYDTITLSGGWEAYLDGGVLVLSEGVNGVNEDTVGIGAYSISAPGFQDPFIMVVYTIDVAVGGYQGDTLCIDSVTIVCGPGVWIWSTNGPLGVFAPDWNLAGNELPYCIPIVNCCIGIRGNVDGDPNDQVNVGDLTYMVDYKYRSGPPPSCLEEANVDGDDFPPGNIADLTYLVSYLFRGGPEPPPCP